MINKIIKLIAYSFYFFVYIFPRDMYYKIKNMLGLKKNVEFEGSCLIEKKICVFAAYPKYGEISDGLLYYVSAIKDLGFSIIFVSNSDIKASEVDKLKKICTKIIIRDNYGRDFGAYKQGVLQFQNEIRDADQLLLANDSVVGPIFDLKQMFSEMELRNIDIWGCSEGYASGAYNNYHVSSYFVVFNYDVLKSSVFWSFWEKYFVTCGRNITIKKGEIKLSTVFQNYGFSVASYVDAQKIYNYVLDTKLDTWQLILPSYFMQSTNFNRSDLNNNYQYEIIKNNLKSYLVRSNPYGLLLLPLLKCGCPFIKKEVYLRQGYYHFEINQMMQSNEFFNLVKKDLPDKQVLTLWAKLQLSIGEK